MKHRPRVLIVYTGGTFGMESNPLSNPDLTPKELKRRFLARVPELESLAVCEVIVAMNRDSAHLGPSEWASLATLVQTHWERYTGVVILHGTDTLAYTASALSYLLRPCKRPVILTGAQRPLAAIRTDARRNLISAVEIAAQGPRKLVNQVSVLFDDRLFQGNRTRKKSAMEFDAFDSPRFAPLAVVGTSIRYAQGAARITISPKIKAAFSQKVAWLHLTPGGPYQALSEALLPQLQGLMLIAFQSGTAPTHQQDFIHLLRRARELGLPVVVTTEGSGASPDPNTYEAGRLMMKEGCLWAGDMTPEAAYVKTQLLVGQTQGLKSFENLWKKSLAGEFNDLG